MARTEIYRDIYILVDGIHLPLSQRVVIAEDSGITTRQILLRDHALLAGDERRTEGWQPAKGRRSA